MDTTYTYTSSVTRAQFLESIITDPPSGTTAELNGDVITFTAPVGSPFNFTVNDNSGYYLVDSHDTEGTYTTTAATNKDINDEGQESLVQGVFLDQQTPDLDEGPSSDIFFESRPFDMVGDGQRRWHGGRRSGDETTDVGGGDGTAGQTGPNLLD